MYIYVYICIYIYIERAYDSGDISFRDVCRHRYRQVLQLLSCRYLYFCTRTASKLSSKMSCTALAKAASVFVLLYYFTSTKVQILTHRCRATIQ